MKIYYKKRMVAAEEGLLIITERWISVHETPETHLCIEESALNRFKSAVSFNNNLSKQQVARKHFRAKRVHKTSSRFAFDSEDKALENLLFLKRLQLKHLERNAKFAECLLANHEDLQPYGNYQLVKNSSELVHEYLRFD